MNEQAGPARTTGRPKKLVALWNKECPDLAVVGAGSLSARLSRLRRRADTAANLEGAQSTHGEGVVPPRVIPGTCVRGSFPDTELTSPRNESRVTPPPHVRQGFSDTEATSPRNESRVTPPPHVRRGSSEESTHRPRAATSARQLGSTRAGNRRGGDISMSLNNIIDPELECSNTVSSACGVVADGTVEERERSSQILDTAAQTEKLREEYCEELADALKVEVGCLDARVRVSCRGKRVDEDLFTSVDNLISQLWEKGERSLWRLNCMVYSAAVVIVGRASKPKGKAETKASEDLVSKRTAEVNLLRRKVGWITSEIVRRKANRKPTGRQWNNLRRLRSLFGRLGLRELQVQLEKLKGALVVRALQLRRLRKTLRRRSLNKRYTNEGPGVFRKRATPENGAQPSADQTSKFWNGVVGVPGVCDLKDAAILSWQRGLMGIPEPGEDDLPDHDSYEKAVRKISSWKAPGRDAIQAFWYKKLPKAALLLWGLFRRVYQSDLALPEWFVRGKTLLIPKGKGGRPEDYRPITCLNTAYKLFTGVMASELWRHVESNGVMPCEQKALHRGQRGCLDALLVDGMITEGAKVRRGGLSVAWIDYRKAYDRVPHVWVCRVLEAIKAPHYIRRCLGDLIPMWKSRFQMGVGKRALKFDQAFGRGLFQGDSLSPLLYCLCIAPLSHALNSETNGVACSSERITHLLFMDDLKVYAKNRTQLEHALDVVGRVSDAVGMELGLTKCAEAHMKNGRVETDEGGGTGLLRLAMKEDPYTYLGITQVFDPDLATIRERLKKDFGRRMNGIWGSELNGLNKVKATNSWAVSIFRYFFACLKWTHRELIKLDRDTRRFMRKHRCHQYGASVQRVHLPRSEGGRGVSSLYHVYEREVLSTACYICGSNDPQLRAVFNHWLFMVRRSRSNILSSANNIIRDYQLDISITGGGVRNIRGLLSPRMASKLLQAAQIERLKQDLREKPVHGVFFVQCEQQEWDFASSHRWLSDGRLQGRTEGLIVAAQDGVIHTRAYRHRVMKKRSEPLKCRKCQKAPETLGHILSCCEKSQWTLLKERHDRVLFRVVQELAVFYGIVLPTWMTWGHSGWTGVGVLEGKGVKLVIDVSVPTDGLLTERRPDLIVYLKPTRQVIIFEVACAWDPLIVERENEKRVKYLPLAAELASQRPGYKVEVRPLVIGDLGTMASLRRELMDSKILDPGGVTKLVKAIQFESLISAVRIIRQQLSVV